MFYIDKVAPKSGFSPHLVWSRPWLWPLTSNLITSLLSRKYNEAVN